MTRRQQGYIIAVDAYGHPIELFPETHRSPAPVWIAPDGERVAVTWRKSDRAAAYERAARKIVQRDTYRVAWGWSSGSASAFLRHHAWHTPHDTPDETALYEAQMRYWRITHGVSS